MADGSDKFGDAAAEGGGDDLYAVLGLKKECTDADLKVAYRKLAMRWHPDKCSASGSSERVEEAKEKFQEIQGAYSVLSDSNKRLLYDVGVYDKEDDDDNLQGMGDFLGEMAQMMSQARPTRQESFEELQQLFLDMFQDDLDARFYSGPTTGHRSKTQSHASSSPSPSLSPSPPPPVVSDAELPSCNGINKRGSSAMDSLKPPRHSEVGAGQSQHGFCFGTSDSSQAPKMRGGSGGSASKRRNGRKQKLSSKHDVSSED